VTVFTTATVFILQPHVSFSLLFYFDFDSEKRHPSRVPTGACEPKTHTGLTSQSTMSSLGRQPSTGLGNKRLEMGRS